MAYISQTKTLGKIAMCGYARRKTAIVVDEDEYLELGRESGKRSLNDSREELDNALEGRIKQKEMMMKNEKDVELKKK